MKKWLKRILLVVALAIVVSLLATAWSWHMLRDTPDWYQPLAYTLEEGRAAANRVDQILLDALSWASEVQAQARASSQPSASATTAPAALKTVSFTEAELNAFFQKWSRDQNWGVYFDQYLSDPVVVLHDGRIIIAGKLKDLNAIASLHLEPSIDEEGQFHLDMAKMLGGKLPLPSSFFSKYRTQVVNGLNRRLPAWQQAALLAPGGANGAAVKAAMSKLFMHALDDEPSDAMIFLPTTSSDRMPVPVRLRDVTIEDKTLTLSVQPLTATESAKLLQRLREPYGTETAAATE
jgi:hypothetical protein